MSEMCELCQKTLAKESIKGVQLCEKCADDVRILLNDDMEMLRFFANESNYYDASLNATKKFVAYAKKRIKFIEYAQERVERIRTSDGSATAHPGNIQDSQNSGVSKQTNDPLIQEEKTKCNGDYCMKYQSILSAEEKREWIERYIGIKKSVVAIYAIIGFAIGIWVAHTFSYGVIGYIVCIGIGCGIASVWGTNAVGSAIMEAITAEQNIITEELLTELLNRAQEE